MLNIVVPIAGRGSRFVAKGYDMPKPLIPIHGVPMIQVVHKNLKPACGHRFIFLCLQEHIDKYAIDKQLRSFDPSCEIVTVKSVTEGAACTVLLAAEYFNNDDPLMIANGDQLIDININDYLNVNGYQDGFIMTMWADDPKWSYLRLNADNEIVEVVEKKVISNEATVGIYNYTQGRLFFEAAKKMILKDFRVNNEFYVAPAYNELIQNGSIIGYYNIGKEYAGMHGLGTPEDLEHYLKVNDGKKTNGLNREEV